MTGIKETTEGQDTEIDTEIEAGDIGNTEDTKDFGKDSGIPGKSGKELDSALDRLMGIKPNETDAPGKKKEVQQDTNIDPATGKPKVGQETTQQPITTSTRVDPARTPRAYGKAFRWDTQGNVVRTDTGTIVATNGAERRAFERTLPIITGIQAEADKYRGMYEAAEKSNTIAANLKLAPEEYAIGARVMAAYKSDPKKAIAFLIKEAQDQGVDMSDLGVQGGGLSRKDVEDLLVDTISKHLEPFKFITENRQQEIQNNELREEANTIIGEFYEAYPDATIHEDSISKIMNAKPGTDLQTAYLILQNHALKHGFDWTKDLAPQAQAWQAKNGKAPVDNGVGNQPVTRQRTLPDLTGRAGNDSIVARNVTSLSGESSTGDIVKDAMRDAGMNIDNI